MIRTARVLLAMLLVFVFACGGSDTPAQEQDPETEATSVQSDDAPSDNATAEPEIATDHKLGRHQNADPPARRFGF